MSNKMLLTAALATAFSATAFAEENTTNPIAPSIDVMQFCQRNSSLKECQDLAAYSEALSQALQETNDQTGTVGLSDEQHAQLAILHAAVTQKMAQDAEISIKEVAAEDSEKTTAE